MTDIEIPFPKDRHFRYRFFEVLPGALSWLVLCLPFILSLIDVDAAVFFIIGYLLLWFIRAIGIDIRAIQGYRTMRMHQKLDWGKMLSELETGEADDDDIKRPSWHATNISRVSSASDAIMPSQLMHVAMVAVYKESREIVEPSIKAIIDSHYDIKKIILVIAYEERGGKSTQELSESLIKEYGHNFYGAFAVKHPKDMPDEIIGKGGNITFAGYRLKKYLDDRNIEPIRVVVTTLDADNRPDKKYFAALSYTYISSLDPVHISFQPIPMYTNNIWDAPAPMRVVATGNSFWNVVLSLRPHMLRNFSSHAQSMQTLIDTNFWSVRTVVEDGHQFWRTYFRYDGNHRVYPVYTPIYQDAVLSGTYIKTLKAQFIQLRRWTYGASDVAYVADKGFFTKSKTSKTDVTFKFLRLLEGHVTWAVAPVLLVSAAFIPALFNPNSYAANELPLLVSRIQTIALLGVAGTLFLSIKALPPKPARYKAHRTVFMVLQWVYLPVTTILYNSMSAFYSQTRLMFGLYYDKFDFTEKGVVKDTPQEKPA